MCIYGPTQWTIVDRVMYASVADNADEFTVTDWPLDLDPSVD